MNFSIFLERLQKNSHSPNRHFMKCFLNRTETLKNGESSIGDHRHFSEFRRVKNDSLRSTAIGAIKDLWVKLNEKPWFFWLLFSSRKKVTTPVKIKLRMSKARSYIKEKPVTTQNSLIWLSKAHLSLTKKSGKNIFLISRTSNARSFIWK